MASPRAVADRLRALAVGSLLLLAIISATHAQKINLSIDHAVLPLHTAHDLSVASWKPKASVTVERVPVPGDAQLVIYKAQATAAANAEGVSVPEPRVNMYAVRAVDERGEVVATRVYPACWLSPSDTVRVQMNQDGRFMALDWIPGTDECSTTSKVISSMTTTAEAEGPVALLPALKPTPATTAASKKPNNKAAKKPAPADADASAPAAEVVEDDEDEVIPPPEKSFVQKYWMYIVPIVIMLFMGGPKEPEQQQGGGRAAAAAGGAARAPARK
ncbi:hypothetical protein AMAG_09582 [Allomyces macrogynus ATCC 38327]|uniref:ER membrane protein complex subunit 10 n=1 Tax=Allomyces macrogynus (strain ATCC 38327) TaxID=578462 RepID=A0A0L0SSX9_ALLM3|nr:hypothetical protein AMAG_09582 [Allomyces macrogynus ATCC 38327]|eukprot:KNE65602.1 hypothetical protein AMAG_09582 [Allomyces macrogynus ATCC 38327]